MDHGRQSPQSNPTPAVNPRVLVVEDHLAMQHAMGLMLREAGFDVVGAAGDVVEALRMIERRRPDVAVVDVNLPSGSGIGLVKSLGDKEATAVLLYTASVDEATLAEAIECGAGGVALKTGTRDELIAAVHCVARGETYIDPHLTRLLIESSEPHLGLLSKREREILGLLATGLTGEGVA